MMVFWIVMPRGSADTNGSEEHTAFIFRVDEQCVPRKPQVSTASWLGIQPSTYVTKTRCACRLKLRQNLRPNTAVSMDVTQLRDVKRRSA
jgi:hypothetical protein